MQNKYQLVVLKTMEELIAYVADVPEVEFVIEAA